jgi:hypothetical protein
MPLGLVALVSWRLVVAIAILGTLAYFALADWLYMVRLAGYVFIIERLEEPQISLPPQPAPTGTGDGAASGPQLQTSIDRNEPILSDLPNLVVET